MQSNFTTNLLFCSMDDKNILREVYG